MEFWFKKWINQNFRVESMIILIEITRILIDMMKIFWFVHFQSEIFLSVSAQTIIDVAQEKIYIERNIQSILSTKNKRNEQYWMTIDISRQLSHDTVADKEIAAKYKIFLLVYPPRNRRRCMRGVNDWKTILEVLHRDCKKSRKE